MIAGILIGSCIKGMVGVLSGAFARKVQSNVAGIAFGAVVGLIFAYFVASMGVENGEHYYLEIMLPGFTAGGVIGFLTQRWGGAPAPKAVRS
jgi:hypothetical protein